MDPKVIYEDKEVLGILKPAGLLMHDIANAPGREPTLASWLLANYPEVSEVGDEPRLRPGIVHRLDKDTSGIVLVARTQPAFIRLKHAFQERNVEKIYLALVRGAVKDERGTIDLPIGIVSGSTKRSIRSEKMQKDAVTEYRTILKLQSPDKSADTSTLLLAMPKTGRTHQIRVHFASLGNPILGDKLYARKQPAYASRLMLHALVITFPVSDTRLLRLEASPDPGFTDVLREAGASKDQLDNLPRIIHRAVHWK